MKRSGILFAMAALLLCAGGPAPLADDDSSAIAYRLMSAAEDGGAFLGVNLREETEHPEGGARITEVVEDSPADEAGLDDDDIIVGFDGQVIRGPVALTERIHAKEPGDTVSVDVIRDGKQLSFEVELGERKSSAYGIAAAPLLDAGSWREVQDKLHAESKRFKVMAPRVGALYGLDWFGKPKLGVQLVETTPELRSHLGGSEDSGVLISKVLPGTPAERAGVQVGDLILSVDGTEVADTEELREALEDKSGETFEIQVMREGRSKSLEVTIEEPDADRPTGPRAYHVVPSPGPAPAPLPAYTPAPVAPVPPGAPVLPPAPAPPVMPVSESSRSV